MNLSLSKPINLFFAKPVLFYLLFGLIPCSHGSDLYFLCGPDEDGCYEGSYNYCFCIPYNDTEAETPYCLDFNNLSCSPLSKTPSCEPSFIYKNQGECLATIFQSKANPPCVIKNYSFCLEHATYMCNENGQLDSCHM